MSRLRHALATTLLGALLAGTAACGSTPDAPSDQAMQTAPAAADSTCFTQMDESQKAQLVSYMNEQGGSIDSTNSNADGTQDICVLEPNGAGYQEHYYRQEDHFGDYLLYSMLLGRSNSSALTTYGLISGDLDVGDYMMLQLLTGVNNDGVVYHPYTLDNSTHQWARNSTPARGVRVTSVSYGPSKPVSYEQARRTPRPAGYADTSLPPASDKVGAVSKDAKGKTQVADTGTRVQNNKNKVTAAPAIPGPQRGDAAASPTTVPKQRKAPPAANPQNNKNKTCPAGYTGAPPNCKKKRR